MSAWRRTRRTPGSTTWPLPLIDSRSWDAACVRHSLRQPPLVALTQRLPKPVGIVRPIALGRFGGRCLPQFLGPLAEPKGVVRPIPDGGPGFSEPPLEARLQRLRVRSLVLGGGGVGDYRGYRRQLTADTRDRSDEPDDAHGQQ